MTKSILLPSLLLLGAGLALPGCVRQLEKPAERVGSFDVVIDFDAQPSPGVALATCECPLPGCTDQDLCPGASASKESPIPFPGDRWATVLIDITAVGTEGTKPFPLNGAVTIALGSGELYGPSRQVTLTNGERQNFPVRMRRTPGETRIWVEDNLPRDDENDGEPSFAAAVSDASLWFDHPKIADIQITDDECCNALQGQRVEITRGELYITRLVGNGFNVQDITAPEWSGLFVFAFNGTDGLRTGTKLLELDGALTEFQSATQLTEPTYVPVNGLCERPKGAPESGQETDVDESGFARSKCPATAECKLDEEGTYRCTPDSDVTLDEFGRRVCVVGSAGCPPGTECTDIEGQGSFCQVSATPMVATAFPTAPYCGPITTSDDLSIEALEGMVVKIESGGTRGVRLEGLPICELPAGDDPINAVRSSCNLVDIVPDGAGNFVPNVDCSQAANGDPILRDDDGRPCLRNNQACIDDGRLYTGLRSSCLDVGDPSVPRCQLADPGDPVLLDREAAGDPVAANSRICRNTLDDFLTGGFRDFGQSKVYFEDAGGATRCATVNFDAITGFDAFAAQEAATRWKSVTGTLRQVRFSGGSSFWMVDVRYPEDLEPL